MQAFMEGARFTDASWLRAQQAPAELLPRLSEAQLREAAWSGASEERYARSLYAEVLAEPEWAERIKRVGAVLAALLAEKLPGATLCSVTLQTSRGLFRVQGEVGGREFTFAVREEVVDDLLDGGDGDAFDRLKRIVEMVALQYRSEAKAS
jgi:hypothetical protein